MPAVESIVELDVVSYSNCITFSPVIVCRVFVVTNESASFEVVTDASAICVVPTAPVAIFAEVTDASASCVVPTAPVAN